ncbi:hypothetical protein D3C76_1582570 [compost metagenome]
MRLGIVVFVDGRAIRSVDADEHAQGAVLQYLGLDLDAASVRKRLLVLQMALSHCGFPPVAVWTYRQC